MDETIPKSVPANPSEPTGSVGAGIDFSNPHSPLAPYFLSTGAVVACGLLALIFFLASTLPLWHTDIWGHMKFGEWIVNHRRLPEHEPFCPWSDKQATYIQFQTLTQVGFFLCYRLGETLVGGDDLRRMAGGVELLRLTFALLVLIKFWLLFGAYRRLGKNTLLACGGLVVVALLNFSTFGVIRPQQVGEICFSLLLLALGQAQLSRRTLALLALLFIFWVNAHGSFLMGLALIFVCWAGQGIQSWQAQNNPGRLWTDGPFRRLGLALILCVSASCLNPHGPWIFRHVLRMAGNPALSMVLEWKPLGLYPIPILVGLPFVGSIIVLGLTQWLSPRPFSPTQWLMVVVFGMGACLQQRLLIWWIFLVPWIALPHWATLGGKALEELAVRLGPRSFRKTLLAGALFLAALMWSPAISWVLSGSPQPLNQSLSQGTVWELAWQLSNSQDSNRPWSPELAEVLRTTYPHRRFSGSIFTSETLGDYLTWALAPQLPISCYSHYHLFTQENWGENQRVLRGQSGWWDLLRQRQGNLLVLEAEIYPQLCQLVREDPGWVVVRDEAGDPSKKTSYDRLFVAIRKKPIAE